MNKWVPAAALMFLAFMANNSTDCAIFLAAAFICLALPERRNA